MRWVWRLVLVLSAVALVGGALILGPYQEEFHRLLYGARPGVRLEGLAVGGQYRHEVFRLVETMARERFEAPEDATIDQKSGVIISERYGTGVHIPATVERVMNAAIGEEVFLDVRPLPPVWTTERLNRLTREVAQFSTRLYGSWSRVYNIRLAADRFGYRLALPGEEFSFNGLVGPYEPKVGWKSARIIDDYGRFTGGLGGGICQVSTTLYNVLLDARLTIVERHAHSRRIEYVPWGRDAAVSYDKDLRFRNDHGFPVLLRMWVAQGHIYAAAFLPSDEEVRATAPVFSDPSAGVAGPTDSVDCG